MTQESLSSTVSCSGVPAGSLREQRSHANLDLAPQYSFPLSTQVAQVAAKTLGISIELVKVKPSNTLTNPNGQATGGSITSELNCLVSSSLYVILLYLTPPLYI